ncbi:hypothetical protein [Actinomadura sp. 6N118]|uniref:hypothetical protein n=1 Tax=Actinomadura sp. 6N118 TaxID=3375151 RepID=UPI0037ABA490
MFIVRGQVRAPGAGDWSGHRVELSFREVTLVDRGPELPPEQVMVVRSTAAALPAGGSFELRLADIKLVSVPITITVTTPDGTELVRRSLTVQQLQQEIVLEATPATPFVIRPSDDPTLGAKVRITGRVIDELGREVPPGLPVVIRGVPKETPAAPPRVLAATSTQASGYFSADWVADLLHSAHGTFAGGQPLPIPLTADDRLPTRVILLTRLSDALVAEADCGCEAVPPLGAEPADVALNSGAYSQDLGGTCQDLTTPNRVVEEFAYHLVVRTTDPQIRGTTIAPRAVIPARVLEDLKRIVLAGSDAHGLTLPRAALGNGHATGNGNPEEITEGSADKADEADKTDKAHKTAELNPRRASGDPGAGQLTLADSGLAPVVEAATVRDLLRRPGPLSAGAVELAVLNKELRRVVDVVEAARREEPARVALDAARPVDWDDAPTLYQATTVAHGHLLQYRQVWRADGYSLGDLLHSVPLAPGQQRQIAIVDWERRQEATRTELLEFEEELDAIVARDRDVTEIAGSRLTEELSGGSRASQWGVAGGIGGGFIGTGWGIFGGVAGGASGASADSWQNSARDLSANALQTLRDRTTQRASSVRDQRSTVVQTVAQNETVRAETEVVANFNHCHAITIQHFEVLRHLLVSHELADVQECLFVPFPISLFDLDKAQRWREPLRRFLQDRSLRGAFDAVERVLRNWEGHDLPQRRFSEEAPEDLQGELRISFVLPRPRDTDDGAFQLSTWRSLAPWLPVDALELWTAKLNQRTQAERDRIFRTEIAPGIAERLVQALKFAYITKSGAEVPITLDPTLVSRYAEGTPLYVTLRAAGPLPPIPREEITRFSISYPGAELPPDAQVVVHAGKVRYRSPHMEHLLFDGPRILNDLGNDDPVVVSTPLARAELRDPRGEDRKLAERLLTHLNERLEHYHQAIWTSMDPARRYMLLDGIIAPNSDGRSVSSVVENRLIGISGNCLILPVAPGIHLDPTVVRDNTRIDLRNAYATPPAPPLRVSVPTRGVYAEAMQGACNACEQIDESRFWRWDKEPIPEADRLTPIEPVSTASRATPVEGLTPTALPSPLVSIQNAPDLPDPLGLRDALNVLAKGDLFKDITGLTQTQKNALAAFKGALDTAEFFGKQAADLAKQQNLGRNIDRTLDQIERARDDGLLSPDQARDLAGSALRALVGKPAQADQPPATDPTVKKVLDAAAQSDSAEVSVTGPGETVEVGYEGAGTVGAGGPPVPRTLPDLVRFVDVPVRKDNLFGPPPVRFDSAPAFREVSVVEQERRVLESTAAGAPRKVGQLGLALLKFGQLRRDRLDSTKFEAKMRLRVTYPTVAGGRAVAGAKLPVVVILHGQAPAWKPKWKSTKTTTISGVDIFDAERIDEDDNHAGYAYLQDALARQGIVSVSVDCNYANTFGSLVEMRADLVFKAMQEMAKLDAERNSPLRDRLDFGKVGLVGHSRGGDAVVRAVKKHLKTPGPRPFDIVAACSLAPTDFTGITRPAVGTEIGRQDLEAGDLDFYLVVYGAQDGDVSGFGGAGAPTGTGFRHYDRARCPKSMVFLDGCNHDRFNSKWPDNDPAVAAGEPVLSRADHQALVIEYIGGMFAWQLTGDTTARPLLNATRANSKGVRVSLQWAFGASHLLVDDFEGGSPNLPGTGRNIPGGPGGPVANIKFMPDISIGGPLDAHTGHQTKVLHIDAGGSGSRKALEITFSAARDLTSATFLTLLFSGHFPDLSKAGIAAAKVPDLKVTLIDDAGASDTVTRLSFEPGWVPSRPFFHQIQRKRLRPPPPAPAPPPLPPDNVTLLRQETAAIALTTFSGVDRTKIRKIVLETVPGAAANVFVDDIRISTQ